MTVVMTDCSARPAIVSPRGQVTADPRSLRFPRLALDAQGRDVGASTNLSHKPATLRFALGLPDWGRS